jgi:hypothetical protein
MRQPAFSLVSGGKPSWINAGIIDVCDNPVTMILLCAAAVVLSSRIMRLKKP